LRIPTINTPFYISVLGGMTYLYRQFRLANDVAAYASEAAATTKAEAEALAAGLPKPEIYEPYPSRLLRAYNNNPKWILPFAEAEIRMLRFKGIFIGLGAPLFVFVMTVRHERNFRKDILASRRQTQGSVFLFCLFF